MYSAGLTALKYNGVFISLINRVNIAIALQDNPSGKGDDVYYRYSGTYDWIGLINRFKAFFLRHCNIRDGSLVQNVTQI
ncbi:MAG: hypothetical protein EA361_07890 [Bacteroidetes bacterium]|nr:MAG: hypothetical protein EA361_07890 [Bacteroidota bacterium]